MLEIYFVRHGETDWNTKRILQGKSDSNLTSEGITQAKKLGKKIRDINFNKIYSSPLKRAMDTTGYILEDQQMEILPISEFEEIGLGAVEGIEREDFLRMYPKEYDDFWAFSTDYAPHIYGGENFQELFARIEKGIQRIISENPEGGKVMVVSHGVTLKSTFCLIKGHGIAGLPEEEIPRNTSLSIVEYSKERGFSIKIFSDISHL